MTRGSFYCAALTAGLFWLSLASAQTTAPQSTVTSPTSAPEEILVAKREKDPIRKADFDMLLPLLEENARAYSENRLEPYRLDLWLSAWARYDANSIDPLVEAMGTIIKGSRNNVVLMRMLNDIITPLQRFDLRVFTPDMAKKIVDVLAPVRANQRYQDIPRLDPRSLERIKMPDVKDTKGVKPEDLLRKTTEVQRARDQKMKTEWPVISNNSQLNELDSRLFTLRLLMAQPEEDKKLVQEMTNALTRHSEFFQISLGLLVKAANNGTLKDARAKEFLTAIMDLYGNASKGEAVKTAIIAKFNEARTQRMGDIFNCLFSPMGKLTEEQRRELANAKIDEAAARKALADNPMSNGFPLFSSLVTFNPEGDSTFQIISFQTKYGLWEVVRNLAGKCGEAIPADFQQR